MKKRHLFKVALATLSLSTLADADAAGAGTSAEEAAKELSNPAGSLASIANRLVYTQYKGDLPNADSQDAWSYQFQPVLPFPVGDSGNRIIFRPAFGVAFNQPGYNSGEEDFEDIDTSLTDTGFDVVYAGTKMHSKHAGYLWGMGIAGTLPTATDNDLGGDQWRGGPELFGGVIRSWGLVGGLLSNQWNIGGGDGGAGSNDQDYSTTTMQYFYSITLPDGWQIVTSPIITYDWKSEDSDEALSLPVGTGIAKTTELFGLHWRFQTEFIYYVQQPDSFGSDWEVKFTVQPVVENPFVGWFR